MSTIWLARNHKKGHVGDIEFQRKGADMNDHPSAMQALADHHDALSRFIANLFASVFQSFTTLHAIRFAAPWKNTGITETPVAEPAGANAG